MLRFLSDQIYFYSFMPDIYTCCSVDIGPEDLDAAFSEPVKCLIMRMPVQIILPDLYNSYGRTCGVKECFA